MPDEDTRDRYVIGKSTAAALDFAAILSMASRIYQPYESTFPGKSEQWLKAAEKAWLWALENENQPYRQPLDVTSGEYGDYTFNDEFAWAASELFMTTKKIKYLEKYMETAEQPSVPSWANVSYLATSTLLLIGEEDIEPSLYQSLKEAQLALANNIVAQHKNNPYRVAMVEADFVWGSNAVVLNKALVLLQAYRLSKEAIYKQVALEHVDYILGRNPTGYSYVTGYGNKTPLFPHHRISASDGIDSPIPGMLVGGPHNGNQDGCVYPSQHSASAYLDDWCSFSTNEVAINWNAPLVYVLAALLDQ
jgi:endoglucanase